MSDSFASRPFPRAPLLGAAAVVGFALVSVAIVRITGAHATQASAPVVAMRDLRFVDRPDGGVAIYDGRDARPIDIVKPGTNGFLRATLRGLARDRLRAGGSENAPFRLSALADGRLTLEDRLTGDRVDLEAFGRTNEDVFARLLTARSRAP